MRINCKLTGEPFEVSDQEVAFLDRLSPIIGDQKISLPLPTVAPDLRKRHRLAFRNERNLYHRTCALSGKNIISVYSPDKKCTVYSKDQFWSDNWDPLNFGRDFDFSRPFFEQFWELKQHVPRRALVCSPDSDDNNCHYISFAGNSKNCYMVFDSDFNEDSLYSSVLKHSRSCMDCSYVYKSELCYSCIDCSYCYEAAFCQDCTNCTNAWFLHNCIGCTDCAFSVNLSQKRYCLWNQQLTKEEYFQKLGALGLNRRSTVERLKKEFATFLVQYPRKYAHIMKAENCTGDYILNARDCHYCFNVSDVEELWYCDSLYNAKSCMDVSSFGEGIERVYESGTIGIGAYNIYFSFECVPSLSDLYYCDECRQTKNCFGSVGLKSHEYCILNKPYPKAEYDKLLLRIFRHMQDTGEWGKPFPASFAIFGYNETMAHIFFPLTKQEALAQGFLWSDYVADPNRKNLTPGDSIPDELEKCNNELIGPVFASSQSGRPFKLVQQEMDLHRTLKVPLPTLHSDERYLERMQLRNPQYLWERKCSATGKPVLSSYAPARPEKILCEEAFVDSLI